MVRSRSAIVSTSGRLDARSKSDSSTRLPLHQPQPRLQPSATASLCRLFASSRLVSSRLDLTSLHFTSLHFFSLHSARLERSLHGSLAKQEAFLPAREREKSETLWPSKWARRANGGLACEQVCQFLRALEMQCERGKEWNLHAPVFICRSRSPVFAATEMCWPRQDRAASFGSGLGAGVGAGPIGGCARGTGGAGDLCRQR